MRNMSDTDGVSTLDDTSGYTSNEGEKQYRLQPLNNSRKGKYCLTFPAITCNINDDQVKLALFATPDKVIYKDHHRAELKYHTGVIPQGTNIHQCLTTQVDDITLDKRKAKVSLRATSLKNCVGSNMPSTETHLIASFYDAIVEKDRTINLLRKKKRTWALIKQGGDIRLKENNSTNIEPISAQDMAEKSDLKCECLKDTIGTNKQNPQTVHTPNLPTLERPADTAVSNNPTERRKKEVSFVRRASTAFMNTLAPNNKKKNDPNNMGSDQIDYEPLKRQSINNYPAVSANNEDDTHKQTPAELSDNEDDEHNQTTAELSDSQDENEDNLNSNNPKQDAVYDYPKKIKTKDGSTRSHQVSHTVNTPSSCKTSEQNTTAKSQEITNERNEKQEEKEEKNNPCKQRKLLIAIITLIPTSIISIASGIVVFVSTEKYIENGLNVFESLLAKAKVITDITTKKEVKMMCFFMNAFLFLGIVTLFAWIICTIVFFIRNHNAEAQTNNPENNEIVPENNNSEQNINQANEQTQQNNVKVDNNDEKNNSEKTKQIRDPDTKKDTKNSKETLVSKEDNGVRDTTLQNTNKLTASKKAPVNAENTALSSANANEINPRKLSVAHA